MFVLNNLPGPHPKYNQCDIFIPIVLRNLQISQRRWGQFSRLMCREGGGNRTSGVFYLESDAACASVLVVAVGCHTPHYSGTG